MKKWTLPLGAALAVILVAVSPADLTNDGDGVHARIRRLLHGEPGHGERIDAHLDAVAAALELSAPQRKEVAALLVGAHPGLETRALALVEAHAEQLELMHAADFDEEALRAASARVGVAQGELVLVAAHLLRDVHRVLTPEQLDRLPQLHRPDLLGFLTEHVRAVGRGMQTWADRQ